MPGNCEEGLLIGGWTNPSEKLVKLEIFPNFRGEKKRDIWNHHLDSHAWHRRVGIFTFLWEVNDGIFTANRFPGTHFTQLLAADFVLFWTPIPKGPWAPKHLGKWKVRLKDHPRTDGSGGDWISPHLFQPLIYGHLGPGVPQPILMGVTNRDDPPSTPWKSY